MSLSGILDNAGPGVPPAASVRHDLGVLPMRVFPDVMGGDVPMLIVVMASA